MTLETEMLLRVTSHPPLATKGAALTHPEMDGNLIALYTALKALNSGAGLTPYDSGETYTGVFYVSFNGNIYKHISGTPTSGVDPDSDPLKWELTSIGELAHVAGTDQYLDFGGGYQVSAQQIYEFINERYIVITKAAFQALVAGADLQAGAMYFISNAAPPIVVTATSNSTIHSSAVIFLACPDIDLVTANWSQAGIYATDELVQWDGKVWKNLGAYTANEPPDDLTNWEEVLYPDDGVEYKGFPCVFTLSIGTEGTFAPLFVYDEWGNEWSFAAFFSGQNKFAIGGANSNNKCKSAIILLGACNINTFANNILENTTLYGENGGDGTFLNNHFINVAITIGGYLNGTFDNCKLNSCTLQLPSGMQAGSVFSNVTILGQNTSYDIRNTVNVPNGGLVTCESSNISDLLTTDSGTDDLDLAQNGATDIYGDFILDFNTTNNIRNLINFPANIKSIKIRPEVGRVVDVKTYDTASVSADYCTVSNAATAGVVTTLNGDNGDYLIATKVVVQGYQCYHIEYKING